LTLESGQQYRFELVARSNCADSVLGFNNRTCVVKDGKAYVQAGAGVVADSIPASEYQETVNKATGMLRAIEWARQLGAA
jgi:anthranilate/para-aminobenzoate synthase component I